MKTLAIRLLICGAAVGVLVSAGQAMDDGDIVWKTYSQVVYPGDGAFTCTGLKNEIARVNGDIAEMDVARRHVEKNIRTAFDLSRYAVRRPMGGSVNSTAVGGDGGENRLAGAHDQIIKSQHVAADRVTYLTQLMVQCKDSPTNP